MSVITEKAPVPVGITATVERRSWKSAIVLAVFAVLAVVLFIPLGRDGDTVFTFADRGGRGYLPPVTLPAHGTGTVVAIVLVLMAAGAFWMTRVRRRAPLWYIALFAALFMVAFLAWAAAGHTLPFTGLLLGTVSLSVPLIFGSLGGVMSERAGVVNIAIEGQLLGGAFVAAMVASVTRSLAAGLIAALVAGMLVSFILAAFSITYLVDQVIVGVVINVFVSGLTGFLYSEVLAKNAALLNHPPTLPSLPIPGLSNIPIIGPVFFDQTLIVYLMYIAVAAVYFALFHTKWGLRVRAVGEHPQAADTVGINVRRTRFWTVSIAGAIAGLGGAYFTLGSVGLFTKDMTGGQGYIALAAVIFGRWHPLRAALAALLFGFATNLQNILGVIGSPVPSEFMLMLPYVVTIFAVAGLVGVSRAPAADGQPYVTS